MTLSTTSSWAAPARPVNGVAADLVAAVCAGSAGVHAALVPAHARESGALGLAFAVCTLSLVAVAVGQVVAPGPVVTAATAVLLIAVATAYLLSRTTGIPGLIAHPEPLDPLGTVVSALETIAAGLAGWPLVRRSSHDPR